MSASTTRENRRPWIVDFLSTLFLAFCIGVATSVVLGAAVVLMAGEARGADGVQLIETVPLTPPGEQQDTVLVGLAAPCPERRAAAAGDQPRRRARSDQGPPSSPRTACPAASAAGGISVGPAAGRRIGARTD